MKETLYGPCSTELPRKPKKGVHMPTRQFPDRSLQSLCRPGHVFPEFLDKTRVEPLQMAVGMWDMSLVKQHAVNKGVFLAGEVDDAEREYKRYVILSFLGAEPPIGERVDQMWHTHILFTEDYVEFCHATGGHFLHHRPGILDNHHTQCQDRRQLTYEAYIHIWGEPSEYWWDGSQPCSGDKCGGNGPSCKKCHCGSEPKR